MYSTPDGLSKHVEDILETLELTKEADYLVGSKEAGGLSIEQTKRLSIAVELAALPSIVFLDEPTSGECCRYFRMPHMWRKAHNITSDIICLLQDWMLVQLYW